MKPSKTSWNLKELKKPIHALAAMAGGAGILIAMIVAFMVNGMIDELEESSIRNIDATKNTLSDMEITLESSSNRMEALNSDLSLVGESMGHLADGIEGSGQTIGSMGEELSTLSLLGEGFSEYSKSLNESGEELITAAEGIDEAGQSISGDGLDNITSGLDMMRDDIGKQKSELEGIKSSLKNTFGTLRLVNIFFFILITIVLGIPILNSIAGII
jgi:methyl-accepting chemotaxis protein